MKNLKERPNEKPLTGDLVVLRHKNNTYYPARLVSVVRKGRWKLIATIEFRKTTPKYWKGTYYQKKCHYNKLTKTRKDTLWEIFIGLFKKKKI